MYCVQNVCQDIYWVGGNDRRLQLFENLFPLPDGVSYNSYLILDKKTALLDAVDSSVSRQFIENIEHVLNGRQLDVLVLNHVEPDHCANIDTLLNKYPSLQVYGNQKTFQLLDQFFGLNRPQNYNIVKENDELSLGKHTMQFIFAPMVHWPEVMFTFEKNKGILFSADAFGSFGALSGNIFADQMDFNTYYLGETRRYYTNIVGKYGMQVQAAMKKVCALDINMICPLHGPIWRENLQYMLDKYDRWSRYSPESKGVVIVYGSMYGNTENAAEILANKLAEKGVENIRVYDVSKINPSYIIAEVFKFSHVVFASPTYNMELYLNMETLISDMARLNIQNKKTAIISNGSWAPAAGAKIRKFLENMKNTEILEPQIDVRSAVTPENIQKIDELAQNIVDSLQVFEI